MQHRTGRPQERAGYVAAIGEELKKRLPLFASMPTRHGGSFWKNARTAALQLTADDNLTLRVDAVDLKNRLRDGETDRRNRLHDWLLRILGALTTPRSMALTCRWRSRPQHQ
jgi:hypothetical protein